MDNDSNSSSYSKLCDDWEIVDAVTIMEGVSGGLGAITCTVALVFAIVSRFYKDIVQRLIVYKLVAMLVYSLSEIVSFRYDYDSEIYKATTLVIPNIVYCVNLVLTFWLTVILYLCIVHLKELKNFKKLEPIAIITSFIPLVIAGSIPFIKYDDCSETLHVQFTEDGRNYYQLYIIAYGTAGILYFIISVLVVIILIAAIRRSRISHKRPDESLLLASFSNRWKILSKQLLPLVVYPIVNTVMAVIFFPLIVHYYTAKTSIGSIFYALISTSGIVTGCIVMLHLLILKWNKKQKERKRRKEREMAGAFCIVPNSYTDKFTRETVASTDAGTMYQFTRTSSFNDEETTTIN
uniref:G-protein coupled receptors family 1 profile domain-containing protein n=1 Tax=Amphimedon queenslandica TaxID=400682 RepID=A0A1X7UD10_AMPQE